MDRHQQQGLSDTVLEKEIDDLLGIEPSPEFLPRVRARIASEPVHADSVWSPPWRWAGLAATLIMVVIGGLWMLREPAPVPRESQPVNTSPGPAHATSTSELETRTSGGADPPSHVKGSDPARPEARIPTAVTRAARQPREVPAAHPEVLISQDEAAALRQLFSAISNRRIETSTLADLESTLAPPAPIEEIVLEPITISPLASLGSE
jgi:hypothetical protein